MTRSGLFMLAGLAVAAASAGALADGVVTISDPAGDGWRVGSFAGGAFRINENSGYVGEFGGTGGSATSFLSFCMERNESVSLTGTYNAAIATSAQMGGVGGSVGGVDPLDSQTASLYRFFRQGGNFGGTIGVIDLATETRSLQRAIWFIEEEIGNPGNGITAADFEGDADALFLYNWSLANDTGIGLVRVLRLTSLSGDFRQDQLTIVPLPPAAWAGIGSLAGVAAIGYVRRRKQLS